MSKQDQLSAVYAADAASQEIRAALSTAREALAEAQVTVRLLEDGCDKVWDKAYGNYLEERRAARTQPCLSCDGRPTRYYDGRRDAREGLSPTSTSSEYSRGHKQGRRDRNLRKWDSLPINEKWCRSKE
jgi:hypothetical protein